MNRRKVTMKITLFAFAFVNLTLPAFGQGVDPMLGVWKWNPEKSMWGDTPTPKSMTVTWAADSGTYVRIGNIVSQNDFKNGKAVDIGQVTLVSDKILQGIYEGIFPNGRQFRIVNIWDKQ
jgi:hypothetical protein